MVEIRDMFILVSALGIITILFIVHVVRVILACCVKMQVTSTYILTIGQQFLGIWSLTSANASLTNC